jgi:FkbM family methyltransferase
MLKAVRNAAASAAAWTLYHAPALERPYAHAAHAALGVPGVHTVFRETTDRLVARLARENRAARRVPVGSLLPVFDVSSFTVKGRYFAGVAYEPGATDAVLTLGEGDVFVDIGANSGYFSVLAALRVGARGRVFAFEPNPAVRRQLERHIGLNAIADRVTISELALSDEDRDDLRLFVSCWPDNDGIASLTPAAETLARGGLRADTSIAVRVRTFDSWVPSVQLSRIDLMKIDVEGAESRVLAGMSSTLARFRPARIICETPIESEAATMLRDRGYLASVVDEIPGGIPNLLFKSPGV